MARPTKLKKKLADRIVAAVRAGAYIETAAAFAGVHKDTLYAWLRRGAEVEGKGLYGEFSDAIEKALAESELHFLEIIRKAAEGDAELDIQPQWQAAAWRLERKFPARWGRKDRHEIAGKVGVTLEIVEEIVEPGTDPSAAESRPSLGTT